MLGWIRRNEGVGSVGGMRSVREVKGGKCTRGRGGWCGGLYKRAWDERFNEGLPGSLKRIPF